MELLQPLTLSTLQPFIDNPAPLVTQPSGFQIAVANYPETPRSLLEVLVNSPDPQVAEAAQLHVNWTGEITEGWQQVLEGDRNTKLTAARSNRIPIHVLEQLAKEPDETVRQAVSQNSNLPLKSLLELARDKSVNVRFSLAYKSSHRQTPIPVQLLERLAQDESEQVRARVAEHPDTPVELLVRLASDSNHQVKVAVVSNLKTPVTVLERLGVGENIFNVHNPNTPGNVLAQAVASLVSNPRSTTHTTISHQSDELLANLIKFSGYTKGSQMPASVLEDLSYYGYCMVRSEVAHHPNTPVSMLERLGNDEWFPVRAGVAKHLNTPPYVLERMARQEDPNGRDGYYYTVCSYIAQRLDAPVSVLEFLSNSHMPRIRQIVAGNLSTSLEVLAQMVEQETDESVLQMLAQNPNLTSTLLQLLAQKLYSNVRILLIHHPNLTADIWTQLARDEDANIRQLIAANSDVPVDILQYLAQDENSDVRSKFATNLNISPECLEALAQDPDAGVRAAIASNPRTPEKILEQLAHDEKVKVRRAVAQNPNTPTLSREALRDLVLQPTTRQTSPTLRSLSRLYNPSTDNLATLLSEYVQSDNAFVRLVTLLHPLTPGEVLQQGARSQSWLERYAVADNPATPPELRQQLAQDSNRYVQAAAKSYL